MHQPELTDEVLASRICERDVAAFGLLYDRYARIIYVIAAHTLGSADAEEEVQEVFLRLWRNADQFRPERGSFSAWFMTVARHRILDRLRQLGQQKQVVVAEAIDHLLVDAADGMPDVEDAAWSREQSQALTQALRGLPVEQRRALVLAYFGGLSQHSIAEQLGWPLGTVKKRIRLGLQKLRAALVTRFNLPPFSPEYGRDETATMPAKALPSDQDDTQ